MDQQSQRQDFTLWHDIAKCYRTGFATITGIFNSDLLAAIEVSAGDRVLDVACGTGDTAQLASQRGAILMCLDAAQGMIEEGRRRCSDLQYCCGDATRLPFGDGIFDAVVANFGIPHVAVPVRGLRESWRVLRRGGRLGFTVWAPPSENTWAKIIFGAVSKFGTILQTSERLAPSATIDRSTWVRLTQISGYPVEAIRVKTVTRHIRIKDSADFLPLIMGGTVLMREVLENQSPDARAMIEHSVKCALEQHRIGKEFSLPATAYLVSAQKL